MSKGLDDYKIISVPTTMVEIKRQQKEHKALEIIKNKNVSAYGIKYTKNVHDYNLSYASNGKELLTQEEYDLLKEVLL